MKFQVYITNSNQLQFYWLYSRSVVAATKSLSGATGGV